MAMLGPRAIAVLSVLALAACKRNERRDPAADARTTMTATTSKFPLQLIADGPLPGNATRFDYQDVDTARGHLVIAHLGDSAVVIVNLADGSVAKRLTNIPVARGVVVAGEANRIFATSSPH